MSNQTELETLQQAMRQAPNTRLYERYMAVRLHLDGRSFTEIAGILGRTYQTVSTYWRAYQDKGLIGLEMEYSPGKPSKLTEEEQQTLSETILNKRPADVGFEAKYTWTLALLVAWIKREYGKSFTPRGMSKLLHRLGFRFTKATYTLANADAQLQAEFRDVTFPALKKQLENGDIDHLLFEDESMIRAYQALQYNWFLQGQQRKIKTYGRHEGAKLFAAVNYETGHVTHREEQVYDTAAFIRFLADIEREYPTGSIILILDNSRIHKAAELDTFLNTHKRLRLIFLPPYSPELNLTEGLWKWLKQDVVNNAFFHKFYHIRIHVAAFMRRVNRHPQEVIDRLLVRL